MTDRRKEKYDRILDAAEKVIADSGYHGAQVSRIAKEAGVADGTIYLYFKNKEAILVELFRDRLGKLVRLCESGVAAAATAAEALKRVCRIHFAELEGNVRLAYVTQIELRQSSLELRREIGRAVKPYLRLLEHILVRGMEEKTFRPGLDVKLTRLLLFGAMDEVVTSWLIAGRRYPLIGQAEGTVAFFLRGIQDESPRGASER